MMTMTKAALCAIALLAAASVGGARAAEQPIGVVYFTQWSALLDQAATGAVENAKTRIDSAKGVVIVTGYADTTGTNEANDLLSKLRAQMVIDQLVADGIPAKRLKRASKGATPDIGGLNESRRVVITIRAQ
jgi:outer membrane protein OmpA-like peptidoglycan-associated protein